MCLEINLVGLFVAKTSPMEIPLTIKFPVGVEVAKWAYDPDQRCFTILNALTYSGVYSNLAHG